MFGLFSKNLKRNRKSTQLRDKEWREHWQEQRSRNLKPEPVRPLLKRTGGKRTAEVIRFRG